MAGNVISQLTTPGAPPYFGDSKRLASLDAFRGLTIVGMILVNSPGDWDIAYAPLKHASWNGITLADVIFPFFLFIVGVSIVLAYTRRLREKLPRRKIVIKIFKRTLLIFAIGLLLNMGQDGFQHLRITGVLQRIAIVFFVAVLLFLYTEIRTQIILGSAILVTYWLALWLVPVPGTGAGIMEPGSNLAAWVDSILLPGRMYQGTWDPEGILSTFPAIVTAITGMVAGRILISRNPAEKKLVILFSLGFLLFLAGGAWNWVFPLNKNLWTSSFVLFTSGLAMMALAAFIWVVDVLEYKKWCEVFVIFGTNAITAYVLHGLLKAPFILINVGGPGEERNIMGAFMERVTGFGVPDQLASLSWALLFTSLCFVPVWLLYRKKIFIRV